MSKGMLLKDWRMWTIAQLRADSEIYNVTAKLRNDNLWRYHAHEKFVKKLMKLWGLDFTSRARQYLKQGKDIAELVHDMEQRLLTEEGKTLQEIAVNPITPFFLFLLSNKKFSEGNLKVEAQINRH